MLDSETVATWQKIEADEDVDLWEAELTSTIICILFLVSYHSLWRS